MSYCKFRAGTYIVVVGDDLGLSEIRFKEKCKLTDVLAIRYKAPTIWSLGHIEIITKGTMTTKRTKQKQKPVPYAFSFETNKVVMVLPFYQDLLNKIRYYHGSQGTIADGWWTWPEDQASGSAEKAAVPPEAAPPEAAPPEAAPALSEADIERAIQSRMTEEKQKKGPACPECGCTSIFADKDADGVIITCLNCGCQWRPGEHRSW